MALRDSIKRATQHAAFQAAKVAGVKVQYSNRGATAVDVYAIINRDDITEDTVLDTDVYVTTKRFVIPVQTNFAFTPDIEDTIAYDGHVWTVTLIGSDSLNAVWQLTAVRRQPRRIK